MTRFLTWKEVDERLDTVAEDDRAGVVGVFLEFEGRPLDVFDGRGARSNINVSTFAHHLGLPRHTINNWLTKYGRAFTG